MSLTTIRLILVPAYTHHLELEIAKSPDLGTLLGAIIPGNWPPETLRDALPYFLDLLRRDPSSIGWNCWYWIRMAHDKEPACLIGDGGFVSPPGSDGVVEIGYSVLPQFQGFGYASEGASALIDWAFGHPEVSNIIGETDHDNAASIRVLNKLGFSLVGPGAEQGRIKWVITR